MKIFRILLLLALALYSQTAIAQDDETRQGTGLPMMIGENSSNRNRAPLSGKITVEGLDKNQSKPTLFVTVFFNGAPVDRRQVNDAGFYYVPSVPRQGATLSIEMNGVEVGIVQLQSSVMGSIRQDFAVNASQSGNAAGKAGVLSAKNFYQRSDENEKLFERAMTAARDKKTSDAVKTFKELLSRDEKDYIAWTELGTLYFREKKYADAEKSYGGALEQKPDFIVALLNLGKLALAQNQPDKAIAVLTKAVESESDSADAHHYLGEAYLQAKKGSKAVVHLNEAIRLAPIEKAEVHLRLAALYNAAGIKNKASAEYKLFLEKVPKYPEREKMEKYVKDNPPE